MAPWVGDPADFMAYGEQTLADAVGPFFPNVPQDEQDTFQYPMPLTDSFWQQHAEPLGAFQWAVMAIEQLLQQLEHNKPLKRGWAQRMAGEGLFKLNTLLEVSPSLDIQPQTSTYVSKWSFPSLLAAIAFGIWENLSEGMSVKSCKRARCRNYFIANTSNKVYCSDRCRQTEEKARKRRKPPDD